MTAQIIEISAAEYHADKVAKAPSLSSGIVQVLIRESPLKAKYAHPKLNPAYKEEHDAKFDIGTCSHAVLLENDASRIVIVQADDWRTKAAKEQRDAARAEGKTALLERHYDAVRRMNDAALAFIYESEIAEYWTEAKSEQTIVWQEPGVTLRCRPDRMALNLRMIIDYKSTTDVAPEAFSRQIVRMGYHWQDAFYRRGVRALDAKDPEFVFLAQSVEPPHECTLHACHPELKLIADADVERAIDLWRECIRKNEWPSYGGRIHWALPTSYQITEHEMRMAA